MCSLVHGDEQQFQFPTHLIVNALQFGLDIVNIANVSIADDAMVNYYFSRQRTVVSSIGKQCLLDVQQKSYIRHRSPFVYCAEETHALF